MILIAESGATKTEWRLVEKGESVMAFSSAGLNPFLLDRTEIAAQIDAVLMERLGKTEDIRHVFFYGAGCILDKAEMMGRLLRERFPLSQIQVMTDMMAASHGLGQGQDGIICILGTGSNSCLYLGGAIRDNVPPLGYILGNEGSAAHLGKVFLRDLLRDMMGKDLKEEVLRDLGMDYGQVIHRLYRDSDANGFLSSLSPHIRRRTHLARVHQIVLDCFRAFLERNVLPYHRPDLRVHFTGSIAYHYEDILSEACFLEGVSLGQVRKCPIDGLVEYYRRKGF